MLKEILYKQIKPLISYIILGIFFSFSLVLGYVAMTSPLLIFNREQERAISPTIYPLNQAEYRQSLLDQRTELIEEFVLGKVTGKANFDKNVSKYDSILKEAARKYKVDCTLIKATMLAESRGIPKARSGVGAIGLMQLMPLTAKSMGYSNITDPRNNIMAGAKYMALLKEKACHEKKKNEVCDVVKDVKYRLAAYNGGPKCNKKDWGECSFKSTCWECEHYDGYDQTRYYVGKVKSNYKKLKDNGWGC